MHQIIGKDMEMCWLLTHIPSLVSNELTSRALVKKILHF